MPGKQHPPIETELTVGQVAARAGVAVSTLHFYESKGLIHSWRNAGNQRRYPREVLRRVAVIKVAQRTGIPLAEIQAALSSLPENRTPTAADWKKTLGTLAGCTGCPHQQPDPSARPARRLHRLRLPVIEGVPATQSLGRAGRRGAGGAAAGRATPSPQSGMPYAAAAPRSAR